MDKAKARKLVPRKKVAAGAGAGGASILVIWIASQFGLDVPPEVASAFTTLVGTLAGYFKSA